MKKALKILLLLAGIFLIISLFLVSYCILITIGTNLDENKLVNVSNTITYYYSNGETISEQSNGIEVTPIKDIPDHVINAFISIEDKRFYNHNGVDVRALGRAVAHNLKSFSFKEGGSTISQQLIKNTHLSSEKTFKRKILEIKLARQLEKKYKKEQIMEKYLNTIYFGEGCYGITQASKYYFNKAPNELSVNEGAILAGIIKAPNTYSPNKNTNNCFNRKNTVLKEMLNQDYVTHNEYQKNVSIKCVSNNNSSKLNFIDLVNKEYNLLVGNNPYFYSNAKVYTTIDPYLQKILDNTSVDLDCYFSIIIMDKNNDVKAYKSNTYAPNRQVGSTIKPLAVYAPAIENNVVYSSSKILDEKQDFNGYCPSNFNDVYYGYVSVKEAMEKSLNTCAVKILNDTGIENALSFLNKMKFPTTDSDNNLALALGATEKGASLQELVSCYNVFLNEGEINHNSAIKNIQDKKNNVIYKKNEKKTRVFSHETITLVNDMLNSVTTKGTARKLSNVKCHLYAKTGTVGSSNGNTDAYCISFNSEYVVGVWLGNKENSTLSNNVTGGSVPANVSSEIWNKLLQKYPNVAPITPSKNVIELELDKLSYDNENCIVLADDNAPERYKIKALFRCDNKPEKKSCFFTKPTINDAKINLIDNKIKISYVCNELINVKIFRCNGLNKVLVHDSFNSPTKYVFLDQNVLNDTIYTYSIIPYYNNGEKVFYGEEVFLDKIKTPFKLNGDIDWWIDDIIMK